MNGDGAMVFSFFMGVLLTFVVMILLLVDCSDKNYKKGQVDVLTGNVKFELVTHPDSTKSWEEIKVVKESK